MKDAPSRPESASAQPVLELKDITKIYLMGDVKVEALRGVSLDIASGEFLSIIGPSGTGKSILLKHIVKLETPDSGEIYIDGHSLFARNKAATPRDYRYSMVFQSSALFNSLTVGENVGFGLGPKRYSRAAREQQVKQFINLAGLAGFEKYYPGAVMEKAALGAGAGRLFHQLLPGLVDAGSRAISGRRHSLSAASLPFGGKPVAHQRPAKMDADWRSVYFGREPAALRCKCDLCRL